MLDESSKEKIIEEGWQKLMTLLANIKIENTLEAVLDFILTPEEKEQVSRRVLLTEDLLQKKRSQREISKRLGVSISTVTRCSNLLKRTPEEVKVCFSEL